MADKILTNEGAAAEVVKAVTAAYKILQSVHVGGKLFRKGTTAQLTKAQAKSAGKLVKPAVATPAAE